MRKLHMWPVFAVAFLAAAFNDIRVAHAEDEWEFLGAKQVAFNAEKDTIEVDAKKGPFKQICLGVFEAGIEMLDLKVVFANGQTEDITVRAVIKAGERTRVIDLPGEARNIAKIELGYKSRGREKATVKVFGKKMAQQPAPQPQPEAKWILLGKRQVAFAKDMDTIELDPKLGPFKQIWIKVTDADLTVADLKVFFANGETADIQVRETIKAGGSTRVIDLPGENRFITKIEMKYSTQGVRDGKAEVHVFGKELAVDWDLLGARVVNFRAEKDEIECDVKKGPYKRIRLHVTGAAIELLDLKVHFANGETCDVQIRAEFKDGEYSRVIDLPGDARNITKVMLAYQTRGRRDGAAKVHVYGRN